MTTQLVGASTGYWRGIAVFLSLAMIVNALVTGYTLLRLLRIVQQVLHDVTR
jgi:hypothetical protein